MMVIATGFIAPSPLFLGLERICCKVLVKGTTRKQGYMRQLPQDDKKIVDTALNIISHYFLLFTQCHKPFPKRQKLDSSKLKEFADDNFKVDENGRKCSKRVENTAGKGEIACYEQFLLFPQCFQKTCTANR